MAIKTSEIIEVKSKLGELTTPANTLASYFEGTELLELSDNGATSAVANKIKTTIEEINEIEVGNLVTAAEAINKVPYVD